MTPERCPTSCSAMPILPSTSSPPRQARRTRQRSPTRCDTRGAADAISPARSRNQADIPTASPETWSLAVQLALAGLVPIIFGLICRVVLRSSAVFLALQAIGVAGGYWAGVEHEGRCAGAARPVPQLDGDELRGIVSGRRIAHPKSIGASGCRGRRHTAWYSVIGPSGQPFAPPCGSDRRAWRPAAKIAPFWH